MGIAIEVASFPVTVPYPLKITLECDARLTLLCRGAEIFSGIGGFQHMNHEAMRTGWMESNVSNGRSWICPECSGKRV
jgi:hypothetical protein